MARENATEVPDCNTDSGDASDIDVRCPRCETRLAANWPEPSCPDCDTSFLVRIFDEFALVERGGWTVGVSLGMADRRGALPDG
ncbi:hypothetical protein [Halorussus sp. AFM4]|uniref:hypothetical protein n=1 Tax=Halorussus sp. AFM4 TaxID=3421651 RepID=UPI003EBCB6A8